MRCCQCLLGARDAFDRLEVVAMESLVAAHAQIEGDAAGAKGSPVMAAVTVELDVVIQLFWVKRASRMYRKSFSANYKSLLPCKERFYHSLVLQEGLDQQEVIHINGQLFRFNQETLTHASAFQSAWQALSLVLRRWSKARQEFQRPSRAELVLVLSALDESWAAFERCHVAELMGLENQAKDLVARAAEAEGILARLEQTGAQAELPEQRRRLVSAISKLNSATNRRGAGRDDHTAGVLETALELQSQGVVMTLTKDLLDAFSSLRMQLRLSAAALESLDPRLSRNEKLASALDDFEKSWESAQQYLSDPALLQSLSGAVLDLAELQRAVPAFECMCERCDVELFLVLPRLLLLSFLAKPSLGPLLGTLLPQHFQNGEPASELLQELLREHRSLAEQLGDSAWERLAGHVIWKAREDPGEQSGPSGFGPVEPLELRDAAERFLLQLEGWSMELQRHRAQEWNSLAALLLQCLEEGQA